MLRATRLSMRSYITFVNQKSPAQWEDFFKTEFQHGIIKDMGIELDNCEVDTTQITSKKPLPPIRMKMKIYDKMIAPTGLVHGGIISTFADTAIGFGCYCYLPGNALKFAVNSTNINYLSSPVLGDEVVAEAIQINSGKLIQTWDSKIYRKKDNKIVSVIRSTAINLYESKTQASSDKELYNKLGSGFQLQKMSKAELAAKFDKLALQWEAYVDTLKYESIFNWLANLCRVELPKFNTSTAKYQIVDLACGIGLIGQNLRNHGAENSKFHLTGIDISKGMLQRALEKKVYNGIFLLDLEVEELPILDESVSVVTFCGATELFSDLNHILKEINRILVAEGQLWVTFQYDPQTGVNPTGHQGITGMSIDAVKTLLTQYGFSVIDVQIEPEAFFTPKKEDGVTTLLPVPYLFIQAKKR